MTSAHDGAPPAADTTRPAANATRPAADATRWIGLDESAVTALARELATRLRPGDVLLLEGEMGAGKTTFTRALAAGLGVRRPDRVCSPTFSVRVEHDGSPRLVHVDLCRLVSLGVEDEAPQAPSAAFEALGLEEWPGDDDDDAVLVVEWAQAWRAPPVDHVRLSFEVDAHEPSLRDVTMVANGRLADALRGLVARV